MAIVQLEGPADEPISLAEARDHLRIQEDDTTQDAWLETFAIPAARASAEHELQRALVSQQWRYTLNAFPDGDIELPRSPVLSVETVKHLDEDGVLQTLVVDVDYVTDIVSGLVSLPFEGSWPVARNIANSVRVEFTTGYGQPDDVPAAIKQWMLLMIGHYYENREATVPGVGLSITQLPFVSTLLDPYRVWVL